MCELTLFWIATNTYLQLQNFNFNPNSSLIPIPNSNSSVWLSVVSVSKDVCQVCDMWHVQTSLKRHNTGRRID